MKNFYAFGSLVSMIVLLLVACAPSTQSDAADRFAGSWSGSMSFTDRETKEDVIVTIPSGCAVGEVCGEIFNSAVNCVWEIHLETVEENVIEYTFSKTLSGECPAMGNGTLTMHENGTLVREHITPNFTSTGTLGRQAEGYKPMYGFAGTWSGTMNSPNDPELKSDIEISIPIGCKIGNICGGLGNFSGQCDVPMVLTNVNNDRFEYEFSTTMGVECPYSDGGALTLQPDGSLIMEHVSTDLNLSAVLSRK